MIKSNNTILLTGGAGFIGSHMTDLLLAHGHDVVVLDKLTYCGNMSNLAHAREISSSGENGHLTFVQGDICDRAQVDQLMLDYAIDHVMHLAAESHVDNSIADPEAFIRTNVVGSFCLLASALAYWQAHKQMDQCRFVHVSTDEVFGHLDDDDPAFTELSPYSPSSPYSASKASSDHFARAWYRTYGLPVIITNCSNNYGPRQHDEKLIPTIIRSALGGHTIPIYGNGKNIRDWIYVKDHCRGLYLAFTKGQPGETYCFGGKNELQNIELAKQICSQLDQLAPRSDGNSYQQQLSFVTDRKGHDWRYAIDGQKAEKILGYQPAFVPSPSSQELQTDHTGNEHQTPFGNPWLAETVRFYLARAQQETKKAPDLEKDMDLDLSEIELDYEGFRQLAKNKNLSKWEKIGFPDSYRQSFETAILQDISCKLEFEHRKGSSLLDIGCGASPLTSKLLCLCQENNINPFMNDSAEMLSQIESSVSFEKISGQFPNTLEEALKVNKGPFDLVLCYSVLHYIIVEHNIFDFIDMVGKALKPGGIALIGDIPNETKRKRFFSSATGVEFHKNFMATTQPPIVEPYTLKANAIDESVLNGLVARAHANGQDAYIVPQSATLPMANRRDDMIIRKL
nr:dTDP-glucose 4,6-dehydratase [uncultured Cohaesibacter sp.]